MRFGDSAGEATGANELNPVDVFRRSGRPGDAGKGGGRGEPEDSDPSFMRNAITPPSSSFIEPAWKAAAGSLGFDVF
jgi:hypothetical protein